MSIDDVHLFSYKHGLFLEWKLFVIDGEQLLVDTVIGF